MQPNNLPEEHEPRGVQENAHVVVNITNANLLDVFTIPSDWTYYLFYSYNIRSGESK